MGCMQHVPSLCFRFILRSSAFLALAAMRFECSTRSKHLDFENYAGRGLGLGCVVGCWGCGRWLGCGGEGWRWKHSLTGGDVVRLGVLEGVEQGEGERGRWVCVA